LARCAPTIIENAIWPGFHTPNPALASNTILYAGVFRRLKRLDMLVASFIRVVQHVPEARLHIVGDPGTSNDGADRALRSLIEQSGVGARTTISPPTDREGIRDALRGARVLALTSEQENAPMIVSEAQAMGVPVVSTRVGGLPWLVHDGADGYLVESGDVVGLARRVVSLLTDRALWERTSAAASRAGERFRREKIAAATAAVYESARGSRSADLGG
jgi:D-inositol-3-phosphate glycosyltransferase